jgi:hypothetical protein
MISYTIENRYALGEEMLENPFLAGGDIFSPSASSRMIVL